MKSFARLVFVVALLGCLVLSASGQAKKAGIVPKTDLKSVVPTNYFFSGQVAPVQLRNSVAIRLADNKLIVAGLVDTSGYSSETAQKYQGFFITEVKVTIDDKTVGPGQYGFGFAKDGKFYVLDVAGNEVASVTAQTDDALKGPTPLQVKQDGSNYRLYAGKKYVVLKAE